MDDIYALKMSHISKEYGGNRVLDDISLNVKPGEIHALMGENGAGKSTLMNILFGMPVIHTTGGFEGTVEVAGKEVLIDSPIKAMEAGIGMVHQEFMLIPGFTITENIKAGREISRPSLLSGILGESLETLDRKAMQRDAHAALERIGLEIDEETYVGGLPVGYMQFIEIAREIDKTGIKMLVFDEPTAVLTESEAARLLETMKVIAGQGIGIIFITHRLDEVMSVADSMTVLRDGKFVDYKEIKNTSAVEIAELMVGRKIGDDSGRNRLKEQRDLSHEPVVMDVKDLVVDMAGEVVRGADFELHRGEILGIGGLAGQGKLGIPNGIMGLVPSGGTVSVGGTPMDITKLGSAVSRKIAFVSEDRRGVGLLLADSVEDNIAFQAMQVNERFLSKLGFAKLVNKAEVKTHAREMIQLLDIRCTSPAQPVGRLSGGNQQKVCLAAALTLNPEILIVSEPTRGIDIGAKNLVMEHLVKLSGEGVSVIVISSELEELRSICDRIAIVSEGRVITTLAPDASDADFGLAMSGVVNQKEGK